MKTQKPTSIIYANPPENASFITPNKQTEEEMIQTQQ